MLPFNRRSFLTVGGLGGLNFCLGDYLKLKADDRINSSAKAQSVIYIYLPGGYAHQETFDPKPLAPAEYKGPLSTINTNVVGTQFSQYLSETSKVADKITVIRSMTHGETAHERGTNNMFTGYRPSPAIQYASMGSIVSHQLGVRNNLPPYITVPNSPNEFAGAGYLSHAYSSFSLGSNPEDPNFQVKDLRLPNGIDETRFKKRQHLLDIVNANFKSKQESDAIKAVDSFYENAYSLMSSNDAINAFDLKLEDEKTKEAYGQNAAGMRMLLSRRLVEAGVRFVTLTYGGWDHHDNIADNMSKQLPAFDKAFAALINDLDQRGLLDSTLVLVGTEFGRTPKINQNAGRDHWPKVFSSVMAGGGIKRGIVYGSSNETASEPSDDPVGVESWAATIYHLLGINYDDVLYAPGDRPIKIIDGGKHLTEIMV
jgi:hypothetical protein